MAAVKSVSAPDFVLHSTHCYFLSPAQISSDIIYEVDRSRDGRTFSSRAVKALQDGKVIFHCLVSFQREGSASTETELSHSNHLMPNVPVPGGDGAPETTVLMKKIERSKIGGFAAEVYYCLDRSWAENLRARKSVEPRYIHVPRSEGCHFV